MENQFKEEVLNFITRRFLYTVAIKDCIYDKLKDAIPFADCNVKTVDDTLDVVSLGFGGEKVDMKFVWETPKCSASPNNFRLNKISL